MKYFILIFLLVGCGDDSSGGGDDDSSTVANPIVHDWAYYNDKTDCTVTFSFKADKTYNHSNSCRDDAGIYRMYVEKGTYYNVSTKVYPKSDKETCDTPTTAGWSLEVINDQLQIKAGGLLLFLTKVESDQQGSGAVTLGCFDDEGNFTEHALD